MHEIGVYREADGREEAIAQLVEDVIAEKKAGKDPIVIAPVHRDGEEFANALRERMRQEGLLGKREITVVRLNPLNLTEAQREDWINYQPGQILEFHQPCKGGFQSGQQWQVLSADGQGVRVKRKGCEKLLSLEQVGGFSVYEARTMAVSAGDDLLFIKNSRYINNGDVHRVVDCSDREIILENGRKLDATKALHVRQGHTMTSQVSQSKERQKMFGLALSSGLAQINATMALVSISRAQREARMYTDSVEMFEERVRRETGHREHSVDLVEGVPAKKEALLEQVMIDGDLKSVWDYERDEERRLAQEQDVEPEREADLQEHAIRGQVRDLDEPEREQEHSLSFEIGT